jgi:hypothetical protein
MTILVVGASGATGRHLVQQLLNNGHNVKAIVRSSKVFIEYVKSCENLSIIEKSILDIIDADIKEYLKDCDAVVSCLGHTLSFKGIYGQPRMLVTKAVQLLCDAIKSNNQNKKVKFILMNTTGNTNRDINEKISFAQKIVIGLIRLLLPPHLDNERAADYLRINIGQDNEKIEWAAVRPDGLINETNVSAYDVHPSPIRSAIFDAGQTSRINVANFMSELISDDNKWDNWKGKMPVIYNI